MLTRRFWTISLVLSACVGQPVFPNGEIPALASEDEYLDFAARPERYEGRAIKLAGRLVSATPTPEGLLILADWLPFPSDPTRGPGEVPQRPVPRFVLLFPGSIDDMGLWQGNELIVAGVAEGRWTTPPTQCRVRHFPLIRALCLHIWKTGASDLREYLEADPLDDRYPPPLDQMYCAEP